jgi:hypothetical protein
MASVCLGPLRRICADDKERANAPFNVRQLSILMHGSEKALVLKEKFMAEVRHQLVPSRASTRPLHHRNHADGSADRQTSCIQAERYSRSLQR